MIHSLSLSVCPYCGVLPNHTAPNACPRCGARITRFDQFETWRRLRRIVRRVLGPPNT